MRLSLIIATYVSIAASQDLDWDAVLQADPLPTASIPVVYATSGKAVTAATLTYSESAILASLVESISSDATATDGAYRLARRASPTTCQAQPTGAGPVPSPDTPSAFLSYSSFASAASGASVPSGYVNTFTNLNASNNAYGYLGFTTLTSYDTAACAKKCTAIDGCQAFNIYFERDPILNPDATGCPNPGSTTQIK